MSIKHWIVLVIDLAVCLLLAIASSAGVRYGYGWLTGTHDADPTLPTLGIWSVVSVLLLQNALILGYVRSRGGLHPLQGSGTPVATGSIGNTLLYSVLAVPLVLVTNLLVGVAFVLFGMKHNQAAQFPLTHGDTLGQVSFFLVAAVFVPVVEEILFRGFVYAKVSQGASPTIAILVSAVVFAAAHSWSASVGSLVLVVQTGALGICLGWVRYRSQSIFPSMIAHGCNNAIALLLVLSCVNHPDLGCAQT
ncbi:MAG: hypothetical protein RLY87_614 [Chloroflexota bacterium]